MNVLLVIDGREAIPVRAIPFLTNGDVLSPAVVAEVLAGDSEYFRLFNGLTAHRVEQGATKPIPTAFWKNTVVSDIDALSDRIKDRQATHVDGPSQWRAGSIECLPAGAFVWRDEFEPRFWATHGPDAETVGRFSSTNGDEWITRNKESEVDLEEESELDFDPFIPSDDLTRLVMEGFDLTGLARDSVLGFDENVQEAGAGSRDAPLQRGAAQDEVVLSAIRSMGHDPMKVPKWNPGKIGVKRSIRDALVGRHPLFQKGSTVFDKTWDRLRSRGEIDDQP